MNKIKPYNFKFRLALVVALVLGGLAFPILFLLAFLVGWSLIQDFRNPQQEVDAWFTRRWTTTADDTKWKTYFLPFCESPAETSFLEAMISSYRLTPNKGLLQGIDLALDMQVKIPPYRVDFLINRWLVVEIDGATYHSSPEATERDKTRDEFLREHGYSVLRIPASVVFTTPDEAISRVKVALFKNKSTTPKHPGTTPYGGAKKISPQEILSAVNRTTSKINSSIVTKQEIEKYTKEHRGKFHAERLFIEKAIEMAESEICVKQFISQSMEHQEAYFSAYDELDNILKKRDVEQKTTFSIPPQPKNETHPDPSINEAISRARQTILSERECFFDSVRLKLRNNENLKTLVREKLNELGCGECWQYLS